jgi:hypothetical protein
VISRGAVRELSAYDVDLVALQSSEGSRFFEFEPDGGRNALFRIDVARLRQAGCDIPEVTGVVGKFNMPGGEFEMRFPCAIKSQYLTPVRPVP